MPVIGTLWSSYGSASSPLDVRDSFLRGLRDNGYVEGQNVAIKEQAYRPNNAEELSAAAYQLVVQKVDVIFAVGTLAALAAKRATASSWRIHDFRKWGKVQTLRFVELCEQYGFKRGADTPVKAQMLPLHAWPARDRAELQEMLDVAAA
jgi:hypothetical protein